MWVEVLSSFYLHFWLYWIKYKSCYFSYWLSLRILTNIWILVKLVSMPRVGLLQTGTVMAVHVQSSTGKQSCSRNLHAEEPWCRVRAVDGLVLTLALAIYSEEGWAPGSEDAFTLHSCAMGYTGTNTSLIKFIAKGRIILLNFARCQILKLRRLPYMPYYFTLMLSIF